MSWPGDIIHAFAPRHCSGYFLCLCPAHDDHRPSLSIKVSQNGNAILLKCHAGCNVEDIVRAAGLKMSDLFRPDDLSTPRPKKRRIVRCYDYLSEDGVLLYQKVRYEPKDFLQRVPDGTGGWNWRMCDVPRRVPYNLPHFARRPDETVFIVEGEKDAETAMALGLLGTCTTEGAGQGWDDPSVYCPFFTGRDVVIIPDANAAGRKHAQRIAGAFLMQGNVLSIRIVCLPEMKGKARDLTDFHVIAGNETRDTILRLTRESTRWIPLGRTCS